MAAVDHVSQRADPLPGFVFQPDRTHHFAIDVGGLLAAAQILHGVVAVPGRDPKRDAAAGAAAVEPEHEAGLFRRPAMIERKDAERAVLADQPRRDLFDEFEARPPHQRAIAEHPQVAFGQFRFGWAFRWHRAHGYQNLEAKRSKITEAFGTWADRLHLTKLSAKGCCMSDMTLVPRRR